jgi:hypothetical protein
MDRLIAHGIAMMLKLRGTGIFCHANIIMIAVAVVVIAVSVIPRNIIISSDLLATNCLDEYI